MIWRFELGAGGAEALEAHHSIPLVALSILLAVLAASTLLPVIERYRSSPSRARSIAWLVAGALAMALGVWAMHFTAMLAHQLPVPVAYNPGLTLVSLVPIFIGSALTLVCSRLLLPRNQRLLLAALALGLGVGAMHYTGMEAMVAPADMRYHLGLKVPEQAEDCRIRVGDEYRHWEEGRGLLFDDTHQHEVWNDTDEERVVLFLDIVRPFDPPIGAINEALIKLISLSPFVTKAKKNQEQWEVRQKAAGDGAATTAPASASAA